MKKLLIILLITPIISFVEPEQETGYRACKQADKTWCVSGYQVIEYDNNLIFTDKECYCRG